MGSCQGCTRENGHKCAVFILTFCSYALFHANRKAFSNVKTSTSKTWTPSPHNDSVPELKPDNIWNDHRLFENHQEVEKFQGYLDTAFMLAYALGLFINGYVGDRVNKRLLLTFGMGNTAVLIFVFGFVCEEVTYYNVYFYMFIWIANGLTQSTGWPVVVACMGNWFGHGSRGLLLGVWSSCASFGNIIGAFLVSSVLSYGYQYAFLVTSSVLMCGTLFTFFGLVPSPTDVGFEEPKDPTVEVQQRTYNPRRSGAHPENEPLLSDGTEEEEDSGEETIGFARGRQIEPKVESASYAVYDAETAKPALSFLKAVLLPGVIPYSLAYAFLKLVNYSFFFWLPLYLNSAFKWPESEADNLSTIYDVAGIIGGTLSGFISDRMGKRSIIVVPMLLLSVPSLFIYSHSPNDKAINSFLMGVIGFFIGGAANLISAAISADLGCQSQVSGDDRALSTVTGIVDGTGSFGAALGQIAVPHLQIALGWHSVFYMFMICMFLTALCLWPLFLKELRTIPWCRRIMWFQRMEYSTSCRINDNRDDSSN